MIGTSICTVKTEPSGRKRHILVDGGHIFDPVPIDSQYFRGCRLIAKVIDCLTSSGALGVAASVRVFPMPQYMIDAVKLGESLTSDWANFEYVQVHSVTGNGNQVNLLKFAWKNL